MQIIAITAPAEIDCAAFMRFCFAAGGAFVPLTLQPDSLWLGPMTDPRSGPCWNCAVRRYRQHLRSSRSQPDTMPEHPERTNFPGRLLPIVASGIWHLLHACRRGVAHQGFVWRMDLRTYEIGGEQVVAIHRCDFCGSAHQPLDVPIKRMRDALSYLYSTTANSV
jgi:bacteriocin biosynthesis cyclodehydratase domain-containing protein